MRKAIRPVTIGLILTLFLFLMSACGGSRSDTEERGEAADPGVSVWQEDGSDPGGKPVGENENKETITMKMTINDTAVTAAWENNESVRSLAELAANGPVTIHMDPYGGFEQIGPIGKSLPSSDTDIETKAGDIMLYTSDQMVIFFGSNSWSYTRLGRITDKTEAELRELLGGKSVTVVVRADQS